jgi:hypothetical protein
MSEQTKPLKEAELRKVATCAICQRLIGRTKLPLFYLVSIERHGIDLNAVNRHAGLEALIGSPRIASVMGTDEDMTAVLMERKTIMVCEECSLDPDTPGCSCVAQLAEIANEHGT